MYMYPFDMMFLFFWVRHPWHLPAQYIRTCSPAPLMSLYSLSCISSSVPIGFCTCHRVSHFSFILPFFRLSSSFFIHHVSMMPSPLMFLSAVLAGLCVFFWNPYQPMSLMPSAYTNISIIPHLWLHHTFSYISDEYLISSSPSSCVSSVTVSIVPNIYVIVCLLH